ncbi:hypothetical protein [Paenibacillus apiarius]|uniref:hypothetical protein n=1 Tax=Paenibacillus apiarius TaxID=46240 RepID=UPI003B3A2290
MKEAIITDLSGRYIEPTLVADSVTGVFDRWEPVQPDEEPRAIPQKDGEQPTEPETVLVGYTVAVPLPDGLYEPTFDVVGYRGAMDTYKAAHSEFLAELDDYDPETGTPEPIAPASVDASLFWRNGLTQDEIDALNPPPQPSELDLLGAMMVQRELEALDLRTENQALGAQVVAKDLQIYDVKAQTGAQGANMVDLDVRVHGLEEKTNV